MGSGVHQGLNSFFFLSLLWRWCWSNYRLAWCNSTNQDIRTNVAGFFFPDGPSDRLNFRFGKRRNTILAVVSQKNYFNFTRLKTVAAQLARVTGERIVSAALANLGARIDR